MVKKKQYEELTNVQDEGTLLPEEFPEGPYGSARGKKKLAESKSTPWEPNQRRASAFTYENRRQHENVPREYPDAHITHDE